MFFYNVERRRHDKIKSQLTSIINQENMSTLGVKYSPKKTTRYQYDKFKCVAQNALGQIETIYQIKAGDLPRAPTVSNVAYSEGNFNFVDLIYLNLFVSELYDILTVFNFN